MEGFLDEGSTVYFCSRTEAAIREAESQLAGRFPKARAVGNVVDVSEPEDLSKWVKTCAEAEGHIDVVVANVSALAIPNTRDNWHASFQTDMMGTYHMVDTALPFLTATKGNIITISSVTGRDIDFTAPSPYGAMKAAVIHYTAQLAHTLAPMGVRANTVSPGNTYIADGVWGSIERNNPELFKSQSTLNPMGRMAKPEEIANAVVFLASEKASFISGANLNVDGALCTGVQF